MKKLLLFGVMSLLVFTGCKKEEKQDDTADKLAQQQALQNATMEELQNAVAERDELLALINDINSDVSEIQSVESIVTMKQVGEGSEKANIKNNLSSIKKTLADRRQRLADLEKKLKDSKLGNDKLLATIETMKKTIDEQEAQIENLTKQLESANQRIGELNTEVSSLNTKVTTVTEERDVAQQEATAQANLANECYYAVGTKKELKNHGILESGFLRKTKVMQGEFDKTFFHKADKRTLTTIPLHSKKAKIITSAQPAASYTFDNVDGEMVLRITSPSLFWGTSNYVVIQID